MYMIPTHDEDSIKSLAAKPPFGYYGAKQRIARRIASMLPPHNAWVEGFCGSAALTLAKPPVPIEVINDLDGEIVNLFKQLRDNSEALCESIALTPYSKEEFESARYQSSSEDPLERARLFLVRTMMAVNATVGSTRCGFSFSQSYTREQKEARVSRWYNLPERLSKLVERLRGIRIENRNAIDIVEMFADRPATLIYLDPPYFTKREHGYVIDANDEDFHRELLSVCRRARCMVLISGYDSELYENLLCGSSKWSKHHIETHTRDTTGKDYSRTEVLWSNRYFDEGVSTGKLRLRLTKKEVAEQKVNPPRRS
ncbi:DNA adenine methylase [Haloferula sp. A504]|uniref:DNA adenine methylase n=1 Tax=Haloferula sp. A504 TaxID=3373601 RepID=UPI0031BEAAA2|nr:DNA adenine methylase [Verrucomicrobiaceae bacterium E54]